MGADSRYVVVRRSDIPNGTLQVLDLKPNTSHKNLVYDPAGQTKYLRYPQNESVATTGAGPITMQRDTKGLAAYLIDHIEAGGVGGGGGPALTWLEANTIALDLIQRAGNGLSMTLADVNASLSSTVPGTELTSAGGSASTGELADVLLILAGAEYTLPGGSVVEDGGNNFEATVSGSFAGEKFRDLYSGVFFSLSNASGHLAKLKSPDFVYLGQSGAAVVVYDSTGAVL